LGKVAVHACVSLRARAAGTERGKYQSLRESHFRFSLPISQLAMALQLIPTCTGRV